MSSEDKFERTKEEKQRCIEIHDASRAELLKRQLSNSESYDKAILSLSSAALALSLTAIKFVIPLETASYLWALEVSWYLFFATITLSLSAFLIGNKAISKQLEIEEDYYVKGLVKAQAEKNSFSSINSTLNYLTGVSFIAAIFLVILFVTTNIEQGQNIMTDKKGSDSKTQTTKKAINSASVPKMQIAPGADNKSTASADVPKMQLAPGSPPANKTAAPASGGNSGTTTDQKK